MSHNAPNMAMMTNRPDAMVFPFLRGCAISGASGLRLTDCAANPVKDLDPDNDCQYGTANSGNRSGLRGNFRNKTGDIHRSMCGRCHQGTKARKSGQRYEFFCEGLVFHGVTFRFQLNRRF